MDTQFKCRDKNGFMKEKDDVVLLVSADSHRAYWPLGYVIEVYPGKDGQVHSVKLQFKDKQLVWPVVKPCLLEQDCSA